MPIGINKLASDIRNLTTRVEHLEKEVERYSKFVDAVSYYFVYYKLWPSFRKFFSEEEPKPKKGSLKSRLQAKKK